MNRTKLLQAAFILLFGLLIYVPSLHNGFIWDDDRYVYSNWMVQSPSSDGLKDLWFTHKTPQYYPLTFSSFWLEFKFWGLNPYGYHTTNLILHLINALLIFWLISKLNKPVAFAVAILFTVHPIQVETVAWITERKNLLAFFFFLMATGIYFRYEKTKQFWLYPLILFCFAGALLSKSVSVCFAVLPIIYSWWKHGTIRRRVILESIPLFVIGLTAALHTAYVEVHRAGAEGESFNLDIAQKVIIAGQNLLFYPYKMAVPVNFMFFYPRPNIRATDLVQWIYPLICILIFAGLWLARKKIGRGAFALAVFYTASIFPALGFFNVFPMQFSFVADHFSYLSSPAILLLLCSTIYLLLKNTANKLTITSNARFRTGAWTLFFIILIFLSWQSKGLTKNYKDSFSLWGNLIKANPTSPAAYVNLGSEYSRMGDVKNAFFSYQKAAQLNPNDFMAFHNLGGAFEAIGKHDEAISAFLRAIELERGCFPAYHNLGIILYKIGKTDQAIAAFRKAVEIRPDYSRSWLALGNIFYEKKAFPAAAEFYKKTLEIDGGNAEAYLRLAAIFHSSGNANIANELARRAGILYSENSKYDEALKRAGI